MSHQLIVIQIHVSQQTNDFIHAYINFAAHGTIWHLLRYSFQIKHRVLQLDGELCGLQDPLFGKKLLALWYQEAVRAPALSCWWARL